MAMEPWGNFEKLHTALKYFLIGRQYHLALKAMYYAERYHTGLRKDGVTKEFHHQLEIGMHITTLKGLINEEICIAAAMLHDVMEDYNIGKETLLQDFPQELVDVVWLLTKKFNGIHKDETAYFHDISQNPHASIVKGIDRIHNVQTMVGVFSIEKQKKYLFTVKEHFIPMLQKARYLFASQNAAYANIEKTLRSQLELIEAIHRAYEMSIQDRAHKDLA